MPQGIERFLTFRRDFAAKGNMPNSSQSGLLRRVHSDDKWEFPWVNDGERQMRNPAPRRSVSRSEAADGGTGARWDRTACTLR